MSRQITRFLTLCCAPGVMLCMLPQSLLSTRSGGGFDTDADISRRESMAKRTACSVSLTRLPNPYRWL